MTKFRYLVGDAIRFHDTTHGALKAAVRLATRDDDDGMGMTDDDWSPEARAAAAASRKAHLATTGTIATPSNHSDASHIHGEAAKIHGGISGSSKEHHQTIAGLHKKAQQMHMDFARNKPDEAQRKEVGRVSSQATSLSEKLLHR